jgi:selenium metabolism protein YedF
VKEPSVTFLYLNSDRMGHGDDELGRELLLKFLWELAAFDAPVDVIGCVNSGVHLTTEGSEVLSSLQKLEARGARIATCGTCLDHLGLRDKLAIGEVGDMATTVQVMATADRVIRPC